MSTPVLIIGKSGSGKSASLRNLEPSITGIFNVLGKPLPFRSTLKSIESDSYGFIMERVVKSKADILVIDDAGYLITTQFMANQGNAKGNSSYAFYNQLACNFWDLIAAIRKIKNNKRIYVMMHDEKNEAGDIKPKTIGNMLDNKVVLEGLFTICLRCAVVNNRHVFFTQSDGFDVAKSPMGMFDELVIDNDLQLVDKAICDYYNIPRLVVAAAA
ncbi:hypothetical protein AGMMS49992_29260 [Clostridia bacterium]|nr:hypothetical protein AGMMS49992_29260 [Clostridia bacterium]